MTSELPTLNESITSKEKLQTVNDIIDNNQKFDPTSLKKTDFTKLIEKLVKSKIEGNALYKQKKYEDAIKIYKEGLESYNKESKDVNREIGYNEQSKEVLDSYKKVLANTALSYYKQGNFEESIKYDLIMIQNDSKYDRSFIRLFKAYTKLNKLSQAVYFAKIFEKFDEGIKKKYKNIDQEIINTTKKLETLQNIEKEKIKSNLIKMVAPLAVLLFAIILYFVLRGKKK